MRQMTRIMTIVITVMFVIGGVLMVAHAQGDPTPKATEITYIDFIAKVDAHDVKSVEYNQSLPTLSGDLVNGTHFTTQNPQTPDFKKYLLEHAVSVSEPPKEAPSAGQVIGTIFQFGFPLLLVGLVVWVYLKRMPGAVGEMKSANVIQRTNVTFADVEGNEEAKEDLRELADFLKSPVKYTRFGAKIPKGTLLYGDPGTGKTLLAKALAGEARVPFIAVSGSEFVEKYVGVGASRVRELFQQARKNKPCIVFIDEIDAIGKQRSGGSQPGHDEQAQTLNQILAEMDGFGPNDGVIVLAATNRLDSLDPALVRAGRFDRHIEVGLPDLKAREAILRIHSRNKPLDKVDLHVVAQMTTGMSGADLESMMNEASIFAARGDHKGGVTMADMDRAFNKVTVGAEKKDRSSVKALDRKITAFHEAGHALVAKLVSKRPVSKVTIIPTTKGALGYANIHDEDKAFETKETLLAEIAIAVGGRAAEEIIFGKEKISSGASSDIEVATRVAAQMVGLYGMTAKIGMVNLEALYGDLSSSNAANADIIAEIKRIINREYKRALTLLQKNKAKLNAIAETLLAQETVFEAQLDGLIAGTEQAPPPSFTDGFAEPKARPRKTKAKDPIAQAS